MTHLIIFLIIAFVGFVYSLKKETLHFQIASGGILASLFAIRLAFFFAGIKLLATIGVIFFILFSIALIVMYLSSKAVPFNIKFAVLLSGIFALLPGLFAIMHWPGIRIIVYLCVISVLYTTFLLLSGKLKGETKLSGLIIFTPMALVNFLLYVIPMYT